MTFKRYKLILPDKERCIAFGVKFEGQDTRTRLWLLGVAQGIKFGGSKETFNVVFSNNRYFHIDCSDTWIMCQVANWLAKYGVTLEEDAPGKDADNFLLVPVDTKG